MGECDLCGHYHELIEGVCAECRRKYVINNSGR